MRRSPSGSSSSSRTRWNRRLTLMLSGTIVLGSGMAASAAPARHQGSQSSGALAFASRSHPRALMSAAKVAGRADRALVHDAKTLRHCRESRPGHCGTVHHALQGAGRRLARAQHHLTHVAGSTGRTTGTASSYRSAREAPKVHVSGQTLSWNRVARMHSYILVRHVPGQMPQTSIVHGRSVTPPPVPGVTVGYSVRTTALYSSWSAEVSIAYPRVGEPTPVKAPDPQAAPALSASGQTLSWNAIAAITTYVLDIKVPGQVDQYTEVTGTAFKPPVVAGKTVHYQVRTAVEGSVWSTEAGISFPATREVTPPTEPKTEPAPAPSPAPGSFEMGVVAGTSTYEIPFVHTVGAHTVRMEASIDSSAAELAPLVEGYAKAGVRLLLLAGFGGRIPSPAEAQNLASWAAAFGPGGTQWKGKSLPADTAVTDIEFGNETSYTYQFSDNSPSGYASRAQSYALRFKEAQTAIQAANPAVGLLAQADSGGNTSAWVDNMFAAVPDLAKRVAGWTVHPYGANWQARLDQLVSNTAAHGAPSSIPIYITEWGLASDNGRCLTDNYGWNKCMSYAEAATTLTTTLTAMRARYGSRLAAFYLYHVRDQKPTGATTDREAYFGALQSAGAAKGVYTTTVQSLIAANR
jgi:hypothetical protein